MGQVVDRVVNQAVPQRPRAAARPPSPQLARLSAARRALVRAEERVGLSSSGAQEVQRALRATPAHGPAPSRREHDSNRDPWSRLGAGSPGVVSISGSTALLLAALAMHQGTHGWCAVLGGQDLGWCAAHELGLDLSRVLVVPTAGLEPAAILAAATALLDGVGALLIGRRAAGALRPRHRRLLAARARERRTTILTSAPWEEALTLEAAPLDADQGRWAAGCSEQAGLVVALRPHPACAPPPAPPPPPAAREMEAGYLRRLAWSLSDPRRGQDSSTLVLGEEGLSHAPLEPAPASLPTGAPTGLPGLEGAG